MRLIYFAPVHARSYAQRPHFMVGRWLDLGVESVLWVDPYPCRLPRWQDLRRPGRLNDQGTVLDERVRVLRVPALPIEPLPGGPWFNRRVLWSSVWRELRQFAAEGPTILGIGRPGALALAALEGLNLRASFFDAMDNFPEFHTGLSRRSMRRYEDRIAAGVDLVVASSSFFAEKFIRRGLRVVKLLNGYPMATLPELQPASDGRPVLGFLGALGKWIDWPLILRLASVLPDADVELVGPCPAPVPKRLPPNVRLLPPCPQTEAGPHLARFSAGLIPFRKTPLTAGMDPIKYYEYRAMGLPVLCTKFGEMALRGPAEDVYFLDEIKADETVALKAVVMQALGRRRDADAVARFRRENDWERRFAGVDLAEMLSEKLAASVPSPFGRGSG